MSEQNVVAFVKEVSRDPALQEKIGALPGDVGALVQLAFTAGFSFTAEEWKAVAASCFGELSESELDNVAGGAVGDVRPCINPGAIQPCIKPISFGGGIFTRFG
ncbi:MAG TPA: Nif11-like leader peptide family RiPP precursor [Aggregatilineales bacterium]|nr:Nif11-like leader peptide family RiPP precursor [Aggregatilineales bacterium]